MNTPLDDPIAEKERLKKISQNADAKILEEMFGGVAGDGMTSYWIVSGSVHQRHGEGCEHDSPERYHGLPAARVQAGKENAGDRTRDQHARVPSVLSSSGRDWVVERWVVRRQAEQRRLHQARLHLQRSQGGAQEGREDRVEEGKEEGQDERESEGVERHLAGPDGGRGLLPV